MRAHTAAIIETSNILSAGDNDRSEKAVRQSEAITAATRPVLSIRAGADKPF